MPNVQEQGSEVPITIENLGDLAGGAAGLVANAAFAQIFKDLEDRGDDGKPRTVTMTVTATKTKTGIVEIDFEAKPSVPKYKTDATAAKWFWDQGSKRHSLKFQPASPSNPDQQTMQFEEGKVAAE